MTTAAGRRRVAVVGAGWAGLAAAVSATDQGHAVTLFEMAHHAGGRARSALHGEWRLDNGQHILIGAYRDTLALMRRVGVDPDAALLRLPLALVQADGSGLRLPAGPAIPAFLRGVLGWREVPLLDRLQLLRLALRWRWQGFRCDARLSVADLARDCPASVFNALLDPLCVAALNTPAKQASGQVLLTVLRDALFGAPGAADLLLPRAPLEDLLPGPALRWLQERGTQWRAGQRVAALTPQGSAWQVDEEAFDHVILACSAAEAARLLAPHAPDWARTAQALRYEPIVTVWLSAPGTRWPHPMLSFAAEAGATVPRPAQFGFDLGQLAGPPGVFSMVVSGAQPWVDQGLDATAQAVLAQWHHILGSAPAARILTVRAEKRATFACVPGLQRPGGHPLPGVSVAGDHVAGPYPATLEGAVRSGLAAARLDATAS